MHPDNVPARAKTNVPRREGPRRERKQVDHGPVMNYNDAEHDAEAEDSSSSSESEISDEERNGHDDPEIDAAEEKAEPAPTVPAPASVDSVVVHNTEWKRVEQVTVDSRGHARSGNGHFIWPVHSVELKERTPIHYFRLMFSDQTSDLIIQETNKRLPAELPRLTNGEFFRFIGLLLAMSETNLPYREDGSSQLPSGMVVQSELPARHPCSSYNRCRFRAYE